MIRVGPAGWSYPDWEGRVYPRKKPREFHPLVFLAQSFECVEINSSFYSFPRREHVERWARLLADRPRFRFTAKLHREFTHEMDSEPREARAQEFSETLEPLARTGALGALLAQFPWSFRLGHQQLERVERLCAWFRREPLVLELRHASWFAPEVLARLSQLGCSLAEIDLPRSATSPPPEHAALGRIGYLRLHGRNAQAWFARDVGRDRKYDYLYSAAEIGEITARARRLAGEHDETYVVTNNHFSGKAVANALEIQTELTGRRARAIPELLDAFPHLARIVRREGQQELF